MRLLLTILFIIKVSFAQINVVSYGAIPNDGINDYTAFKKVSDTLNARGGNTVVTIPSGIYDLRPPYLDNFPDSIQTINQWNVFSLSNCSNVSFIGSGAVTIKYMDNIPFGAKAGIIGVDSSVHIGSLFRFYYCSNISISNINAHGNQQNFHLLNHYGIGTNAYEREHEGVFVENVTGLTISNCNFNYFGRDGIMLLENQSGLKTKNIYIFNSQFNGNGRNGLSHLGGDSIYITSCSFNNNGMVRISSNPASGVDIEPERSAIARNTFFTGCTFSNNNGYSLVSGHNTDSYKIEFNRCSIYNFNNVSLYSSSPLLTFNNCEIVGPVLTGNFPADSVNVFYRCNFSDSLVGYSYSDMGYNYIVSVGTYVPFTECTFTAYKNSIVYSDNNFSTFTNCWFNAMYSSDTGYGNKAIQTNYSTFNGCFFKKGSYPDYKTELNSPSRHNTVNCSTFITF